MLTAILLVLILLWFFGYGPFLALRFPLLELNGRSINLWDILIFIIIIWLIDLLPGPIRTIAAILLVIWLLGTFGIIAVAAFSNIVVIAIIVGLVIYILSQ